MKRFFALLVFFLGLNLYAQGVDHPPYIYYDLKANGTYSEPYYFNEMGPKPDCNVGCWLLIGVPVSPGSNETEYWSPYNQGRCDHGVAKQKYFINPLTNKLELFKHCVSEAEYYQEQQNRFHGRDD